MEEKILKYMKSKLDFGAESTHHTKSSIKKQLLDCIGNVNQSNPKATKRRRINIIPITHK